MPPLGIEEQTNLDQVLGLGKKTTTTIDHPPMSDRAIGLIVAGAIGLLVSFGLAMSLFLSVFSIHNFAAIVVYLAGFVGITFLTSGGRGGWMKWLVRLCAPLPAALIILFGLSALGL